MSAGPGRVCPLRYRYGAASLATLPVRPADTLYVIGGLYGNRPALDALDALVALEPGPVTRCFNGDFHWFDVDDAFFDEVGRRVLAHDATLGNVEAEFASPADDAGCGCAYPEGVDDGVVLRSNEIHRRLKATAARHPEHAARVARLPMAARYRVGGCTVAVVHGDADALAGWGFDVEALDDPGRAGWLRGCFAAAACDLFACTHTCLPALRGVPLDGGRNGGVANNGAAGMPNFAGRTAGLVTRIGRTPAPRPPVAAAELAGVQVALLPLDYDAARWQAEFVAQWPPGSAAHRSYFERIVQGPRYAESRCRPPA